MNQHKTLIFVTVLACSFFVIILYLLYLVNFKNTQPVVSSPRSQTTGNFVIPTASPTITPSLVIKTPSNWKTYTNGDYGFSFSHPSRFKETSPVQGGEAPPEGYIYFSGTSKGDSIRLSVIHFNGTIDELLQKYQSNPALFGNTDWGNIGQVTSKTKNNQLDIVWFSSAPQIQSVMFLGHGLGFLIPYIDNSKGEYDQILSTFKFTDSQAELSDWKKYLLLNYGFSFTYPEIFTPEPDTYNKILKKVANNWWSVELFTKQGDKLTVQDGSPMDWPDCTVRLESKSVVKTNFTIDYFKEKQSTEPYCAGKSTIYLGWYATLTKEQSSGKKSWFVSLSTNNSNQQYRSLLEKSFWEIVDSITIK